MLCSGLRRRQKLVLAGIETVDRCIDVKKKAHGEAKPSI